MSMQSKASGVGFLLLAAGLSFPVAAWASPGPWHLGLRGGLNLASAAFDPEPEAEVSSRTAPHLGVVVRYDLGPGLALQSGLLWTSKGARQEETIDSGSGPVDVESTTRLEYLSVPAWLRFSFGRGATRPFLIVGPALGITLAAKDRTEAGSFDETEDKKDQIEGVEFALDASVGVEFPLGGMRGGLEAGYALGLSNVLDLKAEELRPAHEGHEDDPVARTRTLFFAFTLGN
ncbi:MAG: PorT family protein [Candidatus Eisenbacteria bacterium]|nr:PorT family protein [Candidatus Eisenbacteria bacterium]